ncbi:Progonadoliberin-2 [Varanus komodoensis]|uniref:progonadoliberin-2 n=1 Tax=Varanus komodoensis TaxID=61221 RepID=UPI001CF7A761|nr:progonadoliberin-2 [Varanus komodoensis]KAF7252416.1 Progonadoliberin-2 [Varanus komodoensis]
MARRASLLLSFCIILTVSLHLSEAQHWSHGWYPGGKRQADSAQSLELSEDLKLCDGDDCTYLKIPRDKIVKSLLVDMLARQVQKKK